MKTSTERAQKCRERKRNEKKLKEYTEFLKLHPFPPDTPEDEKIRVYNDRKKEEKEKKKKAQARDRSKKYRLKLKQDAEVHMLQELKELYGDAILYGGPSTDVSERKQSSGKSAAAASKIDERKESPDATATVSKIKRKELPEESGATASKVFKLDNVASGAEFPGSQNIPVGFPCSVCDRPFDDLRRVPAGSVDILAETFPNEDVAEFKVCRACYESLAGGEIPKLSRSNGFVYPPVPIHLFE